MIGRELPQRGDIIRGWGLSFADLFSYSLSLVGEYKRVPIDYLER